ncbi:MAG TPA: Spy/CpxP family protein refolding chaperone [Casimicrobiaceae bacterium]
MRLRQWAVAAALGAAVGAGVALAQPATGPGPGPGMMGGWGGPGMMGGWGGPGAAWGGGPRGTRGWGGGPGMMGGYGGFGMMGGYGGPRLGPALWQLDLTADQQQKIGAIREDTRRRNWDTMGALHAERYRLASLYRADPSDPDAIAAELKKIDELRTTLVKARVEADNKIRALLTPEQREKLRTYTSGWSDDDEDD